MTMSAQIIEVLNNLCLRFGLAIDWTQDNIFPYFEELAAKYIAWECATSWMWIGIGAILVIVGLVLFVADIHYKVADGFIAAFGCVVILVGVSAIVYQVYDILTCNYFPEKKIVEYIQYLIRTTR